MCIYKTILNYTPENGYDDKFYIAFTTIFYKRKQRKKENGSFSFQEMLLTSIAINSLMTKVISHIHFFASLLIPHFRKTLSKTCSCQWQRHANNHWQKEWIFCPPKKPTGLRSQSAHFHTWTKVICIIKYLHWLHNNFY